MSDTADHEAAVQKLVEATLSLFSARLAKAGLTPEQQPLRRSGEGASYAVEYEIDFMRNGNIDDVLEFHVVEDGKPTTNAEEMKAWLHEAFEDVVIQSGKE